MNKVVDIGRNGYLRINEDVAKCLYKNGAYIPKVKKVAFNEVRDENGGVAILKTCIWFKDGTICTTKNCVADKPDKELGIVYCLLKRSLGIVTEDDRIDGTGVMGYIRNLIKNAEDQNKVRDDLNRKKEEARVAHIERQKREHEAAVERKKNKPTIGQRVDNVEQLLAQFVNLLNNANTDKCNGGCHCHKNETKVSPKKTNTKVTKKH